MSLANIRSKMVVALTAGIPSIKWFPNVPDSPEFPMGYFYLGSGQFKRTAGESSGLPQSMRQYAFELQVLLTRPGDLAAAQTILDTLVEGVASVEAILDQTVMSPDGSSSPTTRSFRTQVLPFSGGDWLGVVFSVDILVG